MKRLSRYLLFLVPALLTGCYNLDTAPYSQISSETFWVTPAHAKQGIMGVYASMRRDNHFGKRYMFDNMGDVAFGWQETGYLSFMQGTATEQTSFFATYWQNVYDAVQRSNQVIRRVSQMEVDDAVKKPIVAEAKFLRAFHYNELLNHYGGVPIYDETVDLNTDFNNLLKPRATVAEVRGFIVKDLTEAIADLPVAWDQANYGRATKGAAYSLRGKVHLYAKEWKSAIADLEEVVYNKTNNYGYSLNPDYASLFKLSGQKSSEIIFSLQTLAEGGIEMGLPYALNIGFRGSYGGGNQGMPTTEFVDTYENLDGTTFKWEAHIPGFGQSVANKQKAFMATHTSGKLNTIPDTTLLGKIYRGRDPRLYSTILVPYSYHLGNVANVVRMLQFVVAVGVSENFGQCRNNSGRYHYMWRKFVPEGNENGAMSVREHTPFNLPFIRLADVLLLLSEAYNEDGQLAKAVVEFNKVRVRSSMPGLNSGPAWMVVSSKAQMFDRLVHERAVELAGEGHRFEDLVRWGIAKSRLNGATIKNLFGETWLTRKFSDRDYLWPIPYSEIEKNPALKQNDNW